MNKKKITAFTLLFFFMIAGCSKMEYAPDDRKSGDSQLRVISLAPSITETICALGGASNLAAITEYCKYPADIVNKIPKIGGFTNLNFEIVSSVNADSAFMLPIHRKEFDKLKQLNIDCRLLPLDNIDDIRNSILILGAALNKNDSAIELAGKIDAGLKQPPITQIQNKKVLIVVGRAPDSLTSIFAAGIKTFYSDILKYFGLTNALPAGNIDYPMINSESVIAANPDIIIEIYAPDAGMTANRTIAELKNDWSKLKNINAVKKDNIFFIVKDYAVIPGPRIINLIDDFRNILLEAKK